MLVSTFEMRENYFDFAKRVKLIDKKDSMRRKTKSEDPDSRQSLDVFKKDQSEQLHDEYNELVERHQSMKQYKMTLNDFEVVKVLGRGGYGKVFLVNRKSDKKVFAMKVIKKDRVKNPKQITRTKTERYILEKLEHPFLMHLKYAYTTKDKLFMIINYCPGGELFYHLQRMDFGLSKEHVSDRTDSFCGTAEYMAPEVILKKPYTKSVDWWSLGALMYEMLHGLPPFYTNKREKTFGLIVNNDFVFTNILSQNAMDLITRLLTKNAEKRIGNSDLDAEEIKQHPFFNGIDWDLLFQRRISPPFVPDPKKADQLKYFSQEFTDMAIEKDDQLKFSQNSIGGTGTGGGGAGEDSSNQRQSEWSGFSYQGSVNDSSMKIKVSQI
ncbi:rps6 protein kinase [Stylonychia lemnae]|uniref:Rps6 protein kinase n=1 Tax=Stylonychia lemnae TaxID=5949 RepID=A0A078BBP4_STYLE|nr:rps6 protein kinase [Stylonychia lemnae]|eukprot:CDW90682.1 rps6 protein kinase [Stylonychia lemnae]